MADVKAKGAAKSPAKKKLDEKVKINVDFTMSDVVQLDSEGKKLEFSAEPGQFLELTSDVYRSLSRVNALDYVIARDQFKAYQSANYLTEDESTSEWLQTLERIDHTNNAQSHLDIEGKVPGMYYSWQTPDQLMAMGKKGYRICKDKRVRTVYNQDGLKANEIRRNGATELILMETTQKNFDALMAAEKLKRNRMRDGVGSSARESMGKLGIKAVDA